MSQRIEIPHFSFVLQIRKPRYRMSILNHSCTADKVLGGTKIPVLGPGVEGGEMGHFLGEEVMRQLQAGQRSEVRGRLCPLLRETGPERALTCLRPHSHKQAFHLLHHRRGTSAWLAAGRQDSRVSLRRGRVFLMLPFQTLSSGQDLGSSHGRVGEGLWGTLGVDLRKS